MRRAAPVLLAVAVIVAVAVAVASSGSDDSQDASAARQVVRDAVRAAVVEHDYTKACRYASPRGRRTLVRWYRFSYGPQSDAAEPNRFRSCPQVVRFELRQRAGYERRALRESLRFGRTRVEGDRASVLVTIGAGGPLLWSRVDLRKIDDRWQIDGSDAIPRGS